MPSKLIVHRTDISIDKAPHRFAISGPIGPVKNSRGADFARSDTLIVVGGINDCVTKTTAEKPQVIPQDSSKKANARLPTSLSLQYFPTKLSTKDAARSDIQPSPGSRVAPKRLKKTLFNSFLPKPLFVSRSPLTLKYNAKEAKQNENLAADKPNLEASCETKLSSKVPRSRTMHALQELKNSVSRPSNLSSTFSTFLIEKPDTPPKENDGIDMAVPNRREYIMQKTRTPPNWSPRQPIPQLQLGQVDTAQPSAYWTGRFVALHDRFSTEHMNYVMPNVSTPPSTPCSSGYLRRASQASAQSDINSYTEPPNHLQNDMDLCRRVFAHLASYCVTGEALQSLRRWQEDYARRRNRPQLLPEGCHVQSRGIVSRLFGSSGRHPDRLGQAFLEEAYYSNASNAFGFTNHETEARYLNFR